MITADDLKRYTLPGEFLQAHDGGWDWDFDDSGDRAVVIDAATGNEAFFTGLACVLNADDSIDTYRFYVDGIGIGQQVDAYVGGALKRIMNTDGTSYEFHQSGAVRQVRHVCAGMTGARRKFDAEATVVENAAFLADPWGSRYLDWAARRFVTAQRAGRFVFPDEYVLAHGQDVGGFDVPVVSDWSGLAFARHGDGSLAGYEFRARGATVGQWVRFYPGGAVEQLGSAMGVRDGTCWEFYPSGAQRRVSSWCMGKPVAAREMDEGGNVVDEQGPMVWDAWDGYLDWAVQG